MEGLDANPDIADIILRHHKHIFPKWFRLIVVCANRLIDGRKALMVEYVDLDWVDANPTKPHCGKYRHLGHTSLHDDDCRCGAGLCRDGYVFSCCKLIVYYKVFESADYTLNVDPSSIKLYHTSTKRFCVKQRKPTKLESREFWIGDRVEGNYRNKGFWYNGKIVRRNKDGTYAIQYDDGDFESNVEPKLMRSIRGIYRRWI